MQSKALWLRACVTVLGLSIAVFAVGCSSIVSAVKPGAFSHSCWSARQGGFWSTVEDLGLLAKFQDSFGKDAAVFCEMNEMQTVITTLNLLNESMLAAAGGLQNAKVALQEKDENIQKLIDLLEHNQGIPTAQVLHNVETVTPIISKKTQALQVALHEASNQELSEKAQQHLSQARFHLQESEYYQGYVNAGIYLMEQFIFRGIDGEKIALMLKQPEAKNLTSDELLEIPKSVPNVVTNLKNIIQLNVAIAKVLDAEYKEKIDKEFDQQEPVRQAKIAQLIVKPASSQDQVQQAERHEQLAPKPSDALSLSLTREEIQRVQELLTQLGYEPGPADGVIGSRTQIAIRAFQQKEGMPVTGEASAALLDRLTAVAPR